MAFGLVNRKILVAVKLCKTNIAYDLSSNAKLHNTRDTLCVTCN